MAGTSEQAKAYINRSGEYREKPGLIAGPWIVGTSTNNQGARTDIAAMVATIKQGDKTLKQVAENHSETFIKYHSGAKQLISLLNKKKRNWRTQLYIYTGAAGTGKSYAANKEAKEFLAQEGIDEEPYYLMVPTKGGQLWWQDYNGESVVIIDDFYGEGIDIDTFKRLIDEYPQKVNIKNGSGEFLAKRVYITSNQGWKTWWAKELLANTHNTDAIQRRITVEKQFNTPYTAPRPAPLNTDDHIIDVTSPTPPVTRTYASAGWLGNDLVCEEDDEAIMAEAIQARNPWLNTHLDFLD